VRPQVIGDDHVARLQRRDENLFDVGEKARAIDGPVEDTGGGEPRDPQRREKRTRLPPRAGRVIMDAFASQGATVPSEQIVGDAGFVEKDEVRRIPGGRLSVPDDPRGRYVRPIVFGRPYRFF